MRSVNNTFEVRQIYVKLTLFPSKCYSVYFLKTHNSACLRLDQGLLIPGLVGIPFHLLHSYHVPQEIRKNLDQFGFNNRSSPTA